MNKDTTCEGVSGSWEIQIKWKEDRKDEDVIRAQSFVHELDDEINQEKSPIPECIESITLIKI